MVDIKMVHMDMVDMDMVDGHGHDGHGHGGHGQIRKFKTIDPNCETHPSPQFHKFGTFTVNLPEKGNIYIGKNIDIAKGSHHIPIVQFFFNIVQTAFDPPPPLVLNMYVAIFFERL